MSIQLMVLDDFLHCRRKGDAMQSSIDAMGKT